MLRNFTLKEGKQISWFPEGIFAGTEKYTCYIFILGMSEVVGIPVNWSTDSGAIVHLFRNTHEKRSLPLR